MEGLIVHLTSKVDWEKAQYAGVYTTASLQTEGFIHCSLPDQIVRVANHYYDGAKDLLLLWIDPARLQSEIRWETTDEEVYPHIYGPLNLEAVIAVNAFLPEEDGAFHKLQIPNGLQ